MERGYLLLKSPVPNVFLCQLASPAPHGRIYADPMRPDQRQALVEAVSNLRNDMQSEQLVSIVNLPFWRPLVEALPGHSIVRDCGMVRHGNGRRRGPRVSRLGLCARGVVGRQ